MSTLKVTKDLILRMYAVGDISDRRMADIADEEVGKIEREYAALRERVGKLEADRDASIRRLMEEVEIRHGSFADCWIELRNILENHPEQGGDK